MKFKYNDKQFDSESSYYPFPKNGNVELMAGDTIEFNDDVYSHSYFVASTDCVYNIYFSQVSVPLKSPWKEEG